MTDQRHKIDTIEGQPVYWVQSGEEDFIQFGEDTGNFMYWMKALIDLKENYIFDTQCGLKVTDEIRKKIIGKINMIKSII